MEKRLSGLRLLLKEVDSRLRDSLRSFADKNGYPVVGRIKSSESIAEKVESGRFSKFSEIDDLVAYSIIVPSLKHENSVLAFLDASFDTVTVRKRGQANKSPDSFRFDSTRFIGKLRPRQDGNPADGIYSLSFEVQIRTAFEHAWSVTTHSATYKPEQVDWRRLRLSAHLKAAVEQLDALVVTFDQVSEGFSTSTWPEVDAQAKVVDTISALSNRRVIDQVSMPVSLGRCAESVVNLVKASRSAGFNRVVEETGRALSIIGEEVDAGARCPRSLSVFQWFMSILARRGFLARLGEGHPLPLDSATSLEMVTRDPPFKAFDWNL